MLTHVTLVRHGQNIPYQDGMPKYPGPGLSSLGKMQARKTARYLADYSFDRIYCSDMTRAIETANEIKKLQKAKISYHRELAETSMIIFDKKPLDRKKHEAAMKRARTALRFFNKILEENEGKHTLIVAHGNIIRSIIAKSQGMEIKDSPGIHMVNCAISTLIFEKKKLVCIPKLCYASHHVRRGFKEDLEYFHERRDFFMDVKNRTM